MVGKVSGDGVGLDVGGGVVVGNVTAGGGVKLMLATQVPTGSYIFL